jgi:hypothetical protein
MFFIVRKRIVSFQVKNCVLCANEYHREHVLNADVNILHNNVNNRKQMSIRHSVQM